MSFKNLGLNTQLLENLIDLGYKEATKIQELAIPKVLSGKDVVALAQTGTGKTAAFSLPLIDLLMKKIILTLLLIPILGHWF